MSPNAFDPIVDYTPEDTRKTIIGEYIYRGNIVRGLRGLYVFADYLGPETGDFTGLILGFRYDGQTIPKIRDITSRLFPTQVGGFDLLNPTSLGEDASGELYIVDYTSGNIFKIIPQAR